MLKYYKIDNEIKCNVFIKYLEILQNISYFGNNSRFLEKGMTMTKDIAIIQTILSVIISNNKNNGNFGLLFI